MNVVEMLTLLAEVVDSVQRAVEHFESGETSSGMSGLDSCIARIEHALDGSSGEGTAEHSDLPETTEIRGELEAVLEDLRAAKAVLSATGSQEREN